MNGKKILKMMLIAFLFCGMTVINASEKRESLAAVETVALADFLNDISKKHEVFFYL